ncbi:amino acid/amide ABC transporter membrane protein 2 (HAAT family) /amino acid/amide ABC transporter ATP-binding protein 1 (HAAT family) [Actinomadura pelletieri DSM 43383]|uniref:Amino acid/amide ABC transporter membrane protein 2 (HAAT family) /amino acid/amide ABC transporter ATP-binding protein 1 (HAAT family) n=1 Tax=Actinomadura pelletieri DSM 43383 TaxID=1120940 RepID=A0A495QUT8_9ACTN|nr:ATP-binding cassette domain-containing protein [Actinomadura pelletieri]RKS77260.1 amino acid/amide ABC transporter membrane protein 2 (HAAT family) /amino acid/amide ABC transporter ATP-binding protein 1 (HAAT family) [Actinomadura pelletieri DSM 43383]
MRRVDLTMFTQPGAALLVVVVAAIAVPQYWLFLATSALVSAVSLLGLGIVGRAGMNSLCQLSFAAVGAWVVAQLNVWQAPGTLILWTLAGGLVAMPFGALIGLPALRLRGVHLAVVTLGFAAAADVVVSAINFPGVDSYQQVMRPEFIATDRQYFVYAGVLFVVLALAVEWLGRTRMGAAWRAVKFSERATAAAGTSVARAKLSAFALSAFAAGVAGGLLAGQVGMITAQNFGTIASLALFVVAVMAGSEYVFGALFGGFLIMFVPELFRRAGVSQDWANVLFGIGAVQALSQGSSISEGFARRLRARRPAPVPPPREASDGGTPPLGTKPLLKAEGLGVRFGQVVALQDVDLVVPEGTVMGLIGPNGAGKSTLTDALSGFLKDATGTVTLDGRRLDGLPVHRRSADGLRRTFQQDRVPTGLTVGAYLRFAAHRSVSHEELEEVRAFLGCAPEKAHVLDLDVGSRRLLEVAAAILARPKLIVLDEPAAGLAHAESLALAERLIEVPAKFGASVLLIEHDLDMVRRACATIVVLDAGAVIAEGPPAEVLARPEVARAYLGDEVALT